jgi:hypothetical protein
LESRLSSIDEHAARGLVVQHEVCFFGPAQTWHDPAGFVPWPINQVVPRLPAAPTGQHGQPARKRQAQDWPGVGVRGVRPDRPHGIPLPPHLIQVSHSHTTSPLPTRFACPIVRGPPAAPSPPRRRHYGISVTGDIDGSPTLLPCGSPHSGSPLVPPNLEIPNPNLVIVSCLLVACRRALDPHFRLRAPTWQVHSSLTLPPQSAIPNPNPNLLFAACLWALVGCRLTTSWSC